MKKPIKCPMCNKKVHYGKTCSCGYTYATPLQHLLFLSKTVITLLIIIAGLYVVADKFI